MDIFYNTYDKNEIFKRRILSGRVKLDLEEDEYLQGVSCIIVKDNSILFEVRSNTQDGSNLMDFCSGHVDNDEDPRTTMIRELGEELGIPKEIANNIIELKHYSLVAERRQSQKKWFMTFFYLEIPETINLIVQESEVKKIIFLPIEDAFDLIRDNKKLQFPFDNNMEEVIGKVKQLKR